MKLTLFKVDAKNNITLFTIIVYAMMMYFSVIAYMFDPIDTSSWTEMLDLLPEGLMAGFGFDQVSTNLTGFIVNFYYGFLVFVFPMIYCIIVSNRLVAKMVDNGSFAYLLMSPVSRRTIIITKEFFLLSSIALLFSILHMAGVSVCRMLFGNMLNERVFLMVNINAALLIMTIGMICFFYSCYFNESRMALAFSSGVSIVSLLLFILGGVSEKSEFLKGISIFSLLNSSEILAGGGSIGAVVLLILMIVILLVLSVFVFEKKNLSL